MPCKSPNDDCSGLERHNLRLQLEREGGGGALTLLIANICDTVWFFVHNISCSYFINYVDSLLWCAKLIKDKHSPEYTL